MKKIGILTFFGIPNAGAFAQAYALQKTIQKMEPDSEVYQIKHLSESHRRVYHMDDLNVEKWQKDLNTIFADEFDKIPHIGLNEIDLDVVVLGSDIIWDFSNWDDKYLYGNDIKAKKVVSYAPSFGFCKSEWRRIPEFVRSGLLSLDAISVRDENAAILTEYIVGKRPLIVLDPVWLWDWNDDINIPEPNKENYIMVYGMDFSDSFIENLIEYAKENKLKLISYPNNDVVYPWCDEILDNTLVTPLELFGYFKKAALVATSTFHGMTFGLLFEKKIAYERTPFIDAKIKQLLIDIGIDSYFDNNGDVVSMYNQPWDYGYIRKKIDEKRAESVAYIMSAI